MSSNHSVGAINQLADSLDAAGFTPDYVTKLRQYEELSKIKDLLDGYAEIKYIEHLINCDANPFCPNGWEVVEHKKGGQMKWDMAKQAGALYLSKKQEGGVIGGNKLRKEVENQPVLNANVLDYLFANPHLIPEEWKGKYVFFWGTIYRRSDGLLVVRCLGWDGGEWRWYYRWLVYGFDSGIPAALRAS